MTRSRWLSPPDPRAVVTALALIILACLALGVRSLLAAEIYGTVTRVIDGDTIALGEVRIRLWGIDAPERAQTCGDGWRCGDAATYALSALVIGQAVACEVKDVDRYGRLVAACAIADMDIGALMVRLGFALDYEQYSGGAYRAEQTLAEAAGAGIWAGGEFVPPWQWRAAR